VAKRPAMDDCGMDCDDWCDRRHSVERTAKIKTSF
jgi:hypothetical protein